MRIVIMGCGRVGSALAADLSREGNEVVVLDQDPAAFRFLETHNHGSYLDATSVATSDEMFDAIAAFVRRGQDAGTLRAGAPAMLIALAFGAFIGLVKEADAGHLTLDASLVERFKSHVIHPVLKACAEMRPAVDISVA